MNKLYYGDCLTIMAEMPPESVDLVYLDPPFNSNRDYNALYKDETGRPLPDQVEAFTDTWTLNAETERAADGLPVLMREAGLDDDVAEYWRHWLKALRYTEPAMLAYVAYMASRLLPMRRLLKPTGSIYLHCDPTASHYLKAMMDGIFGSGNFRSEVIWKRTGAHGGAKRWGPVHDVLLFYSKSHTHVWNRVFEEYDPEYIERHYRNVDSRGRYRTVVLTGPGLSKGSSGKPWRGVDPSPRHWGLPSEKSLPDWFEYPEGYAGMSCQERLDVLDEQGLIYWPPRGTIPNYKRYLDIAKGNPVQDIISDIPPVSPTAKERLGYATQKPLALLERIIAASSNEGDVVFDPFCGCATTIEAAHKLGRKWIGIDIAIHAIKRVATVRLRDRLGLREGTDFEVEGVPRNIEGARDLWERDKYHFQKWAVEQVDGFVTTRKGSDGGIDDRLYFDVPGERGLQSMVIEVKGGANVGIGTVRDLRGVLEREDARMAGLILMDAPGDRQARNFEAEMAQAGHMEVLGKPYRRMQMLTAGEILEDKKFDTPSVARGKAQGQPVLPEWRDLPEGIAMKKSSL